jgi:predicted ATPase
VSAFSFQPADLARQIQDALTQLYDPLALQTHPLTQQLVAQDPRVSPARAGKALRHQLLEAIAALRPATKTGDASPAWRTYRLLELRYLEAHEPAAVQAQLGISRSQFYRDQARALQAVASVLAAQWGPERTREAAHPHRLPASSVPSQAPTERPRGWLPRVLSSFVGRERELQELRTLLPQTRLLTLTGPGGSGKTRLALQAATAVTPEYAGGVCFVDLAPLRDPGLVLTAVAQALDVHETGDQTLPQRLAATLRAQHLLLVLDNFEQVIDAGPAITDLLGACPKVHVLVTSREALRVSGEQEYPVLPLALPLALPDHASAGDVAHLAPVAQNEAVALFVQRARAVRPDFQLTVACAPAVVEICRQLDGLPLALELAAARLKLLSPQAVLDRLDGRFRLLTDGPRDLPGRQQTLRQTIDWSYALLADDERRAFARLAVFSGGWTLEAAEAVCAGDGSNPIGSIAPTAVLDLLSQLVSKSLVVADVSSDPDGEPRYRLLETLRQYAWERLDASGELEAVQRRHATYYLAFAERAQWEIGGGPQQAWWLDQYEREQANLQDALEWAVREQESAIALRLVRMLCISWMVRGPYGEGRRRLAQVLALGGADGHADVRSHVFSDAGVLAWMQGDYTAAKDALEQGLAIGRELNHPFYIAYPLALLGLVADHRGDHQEAVQLLEESLPLFQNLKDTMHVAWCLNALGIVARHQGDYQRAVARYREALALRRQLGDVRAVASTLHDLAYVALRQGEAPRAARLFHISLARYQELRSERGIAECLAGLGGVAGDQGDWWGATRLLGAASALLDRIGARMDMVDQVEYERDLGAARRTLDQRSFAAAWAEGQGLPLEQVIEDALMDGLLPVRLDSQSHNKVRWLAAGSGTARSSWQPLSQA